MGTNEGGHIPFDRAEMGAQKWLNEEYDNLPKIARDLLKYAPLNIQISDYGIYLIKNTQYLEEKIREYEEFVKIRMKKSTIQTYGPDHPQAQ